MNKSRPRINKQQLVDYIIKENEGEKLLSLAKLKDYIVESFGLKDKCYAGRAIDRLCKDKVLIKIGNNAMDPFIKINKKL